MQVLASAMTDGTLNFENTRADKFALGLTLAQMPMLGTLVGNDSTQHTTVGTRLLLSPLHEHAIWSVCTNSAP